MYIFMSSTMIYDAAWIRIAGETKREAFGSCLVSTSSLVNNPLSQKSQNLNPPSVLKLNFLLKTMSMNTAITMIIQANFCHHFGVNIGH